MAVVDFRGNYPPIWLNFLILYLLVSAVKSDPFGCKGVQCPPEISCPNDSVLHMTYEPPKIPKNHINNGNSIYNNNPGQMRRNNKKFIIEQNNDELNDHILDKRSLQYKRRESIKIVPGDYISLVPESVRYHHQLHQNQHKWKRNIQQDTNTNDDDDGSIIPPPNISDIEECCPTMYCMCKKTCPKPKCHQSNKVPQMISPGLNTPGNCCPLYECIDLPKCDNIQRSLPFLLNDCTNCTCLSGQRICHNQCRDIQQKFSCFSNILTKFFQDGQMWKEGDCTQCECLDGEKRCTQSFCKPLNCKHKIKIEGECCPQCIPEINTTTVPYSKDNVNYLFKITTIDDNSSTTVETSSTPSPTTSSTPSSPPIQQTTEIDEDFKLTTLQEDVISFDTISTSSASPLETTSAILSKLMISTTPKVTKKLLFVDSNESTTPTIYTTTNQSSLSGNYNYDTESIILYTIIIVLLAVCCIFAGLYVHEVTKKRSYSSIPNSDSNLSQVPRPKIQESA